MRFKGLNYEHTNSANYSPLQSDKNVFWEEIGQELKALEAIIHAPEPSPEVGLLEELLLAA